MLRIFTSFYFTLHHVTSLYFILLFFYFTSHNLTFLHSYITLLHFFSLLVLHITSPYFPSLHFTSLYFASLHLISCHVTSLRFTLLHVTSRKVNTGQQEAISAFNWNLTGVVIYLVCWCLVLQRLVDHGSLLPSGGRNQFIMFHQILNFTTDGCNYFYIAKTESPALQLQAESCFRLQAESCSRLQAEALIRR